MTDSPSSILLTREQSTGSNINLWGGYLITTQRTTERATKGYQALAVTGDATISWTNYSATNDGAVAFLKLTGTLSAAATLTFPGYQHFLDGINSTGQSVTIKCSGGTGVTVTNGDRFLLYCDGVDYYQAAATQIGGKLTAVTAGVSGTDAVNVAQLAAAIAASVPAGTAGTALVSVTDTTRKFLRDAWTTQIGSLTTTQVAGLQTLQLVKLNAGGNEQIAIVAGNGYVGGFLDGGLQSSQFTPVVGTAYDCNATSAGFTINIGGMTTPQVGQEFATNKFGYGAMYFNGTVNGQSSYVYTETERKIWRYTGSTWGWN